MITAKLSNGQQLILDATTTETGKLKDGITVEDFIKDQLEKESQTTDEK